MRRVIILACVILGIYQLPLQAQIIPIPNHFILSPYTYNPSLVGFDQYVEVQLMHKQQWIGIDNAPAISNLTFQMPFSRQVNFGANLMYDKNGLFQNTMAVGTFGYMLPLGYKQNIRFGLSGGFYSQQYNTSQSSNPADPAITNYENQFNPMGSFGITYQYGTAHFGIALPNLFSTTYTTNADLPTPTNNRQYLSQMIVSGGMKMEVNENFKVEPSAIFRYVQNDNSLLEIATLVHYQDFLWAGGSYRLESGPSILLGGAYQNFRFGYAHELATNVVNGFGGGSHEFFLSYRIGNKKTFEDVVRPPKKVKTPKPAKEKEQKTEKEEKPVEKKIKQNEEPKQKKATEEKDQLQGDPLKEVMEVDTLQTAKKISDTKKKEEKPAQVKPPKKEKQSRVKKTKAPKLENIKIEEKEEQNTNFQEPVEEIQSQPEPKVVVADNKASAPSKAEQKPTEQNFEATKLIVKDPSISKGYYVTVGVFEEEQNAIDFKQKMINLGFKDTDYIYSPVKKYNYVFVLQTKDLTEARILWLELRSSPGFEETWVYTIEVQ